MYIAVKTNENLEKTIKSLLEANLGIEIRKHTHMAFIDVNLKKYGYGAYLSFDVGKYLLIFSYDPNNKKSISIDLEDICTVWNLD